MDALRVIFRVKPTKDGARVPIGKGYPNEGRIAKFETGEFGIGSPTRSFYSTRADALHEEFGRIDSLTSEIEKALTSLKKNIKNHP